MTKESKRERKPTQEKTYWFLAHGLALNTVYYFEKSQHFKTDAIFTLFPFRHFSQMGLKIFSDNKTGSCGTEPREHCKPSAYINDSRTLSVCRYVWMRVCMWDITSKWINSGVNICISIHFCITFQQMSQVF